MTTDDAVPPEPAVAVLMRSEVRLRQTVLLTWMIFSGTLLLAVGFRTPATIWSTAVALLLAAWLHRHFAARLHRTRGALSTLLPQPLGTALHVPARGLAPVIGPITRRWHGHMRHAVHAMIACSVLASVLALHCYAVLSLQSAHTDLVSLLPRMWLSIWLSVAMLLFAALGGVYMVAAAWLYLKAFKREFIAAVPGATAADARLALMHAG